MDYFFRLKVFVLVGLLGCIVSISATAGAIPPQLEAVLITKIVSFETRLSKVSPLSIYVVDSPKLLQKLKELHKNPRKGINFTLVTGGKVIPTTAYDLLYVEKDANFEQAMKYATEFNCLVLTGNSDLVAKGLALGLTLESGKPRILLNLRASKERGHVWHSTLLKIAKHLH